jgi:hypothetical protein
MRTLKTASLALIYSTAKHIAPVWLNSVQTSRVKIQLKQSNAFNFNFRDPEMNTITMTLENMQSLFYSKNCGESHENQFGRLTATGTKLFGSESLDRGKKYGHTCKWTSFLESNISTNWVKSLTT